MNDEMCNFDGVKSIDHVQDMMDVGFNDDTQNVQH